jgi:hypothetical protein
MGIRLDPKAFGAVKRRFEGNNQPDIRTKEATQERNRSMRRQRELFGYNETGFRLVGEQAEDSWTAAAEIQEQTEAKALQARQQLDLLGRPEVIAHCGKEIADWLDPKGTLQKTGLLIID